METKIFAGMTDIFYIFTLHILYRQLLGVRYKSRLPLLLGWGAGFLLWNMSGCLSAENIFLRGICVGAVNFTALCFLYGGNVKRKAALAAGVVLSEMAAGGIMACITILLSISGREYWGGVYPAEPGNIFSKLICIVTVKVITVNSQKQTRIKTELTDWMEILLAPMGSIVICCALWQDGDRAVGWPLILIFAVLLMINLAVYHMYRRIHSLCVECGDGELLRQQNEYYRLWCEEMEKQWLQLRRMRHDMANSCVLEMEYLEKGQYETLMEHYNEKLGHIKKLGNIVNTGNIGIDSILNYKLEIAREYQIEVERKIKIDSKITISNRDLNIMIGNLFDNALEAVRELAAEKRKIHITARADRSAFLFEIFNPYEGVRVRDGSGNFLTGKGDRVCHGLGLKEVREIVKRYDGEMIINDENGEFGVIVFVYL